MILIAGSESRTGAGTAAFWSRDLDIQRKKILTKKEPTTEPLEPFHAQTVTELNRKVRVTQSKRRLAQGVRSLFVMFGHFFITFSDASVTYFVTFLPNSFSQTPFAAG